MTSVLCAHRQQPPRGQHARRLWDPDDRDICRSPQLLSFIRGRWGVWAGESSCGPPSPPTPPPCPPRPHLGPLCGVGRGSAATVAVHGES